MKTAISIPDSIFQAAERAAHQLKMSRSELYARAISAFLERHHFEGITAKLDKVYAKVESDTESEWLRAQAEALKQEQW